MRDVVAQHGQDHIPLVGNDPYVYAGYTIKITTDDGVGSEAQQTLTVQDGFFIWTLPKDVYGKSLRDVEAFVTTEGSDDVVISLYNIDQAVDMLSTSITIDAGDIVSDDSVSPRVLDADNCVIAKGDRVSVNIDADGGGDAKGLGIHARFW